MAVMQSQRGSAFFLKWFDRKECLFFGTHDDDKLGATSDGERLFKKCFVLEMNRKFILNAEPINTSDFTVGVDFSLHQGYGQGYTLPREQHQQVHCRQRLVGAGTERVSMHAGVVQKGNGGTTALY
jgi:hypothetical protein